MERISRYSIAHLTLWLVLLLVSQSVYSQNINELEKQKKATQARIQNANSLIEAASKNQKISTEKLNLIQSQIISRNELIQNISQQIALYEEKIQDKKAELEKLQNDVEQLKKEYAEFLCKSQFTSSTGQLLIHILASKNLSQMYRRVRFYKEYLGYREMQYELIRQQDVRVREEQDSLARDRDKLLDLQHEEINTRKGLEEDKGRFNQEVSRLMAQQKELRAQIAEDEKQMQAINNAIRSLLAEEAKKNESKKRDASYLKLSSSFAENKGKIPWPVVNGVISRGYGQESNKLFKGIQTKSEGIDIMTRKNSSVMAVFPGEVSKIAHIPGGNNVVIIRHGDYLTLYSNLAEVIVRAGENVKAMQKIGTVFTDGSNNQTTLHFEIWHGFKSQNPRQWLLP